MRPLYLTYSGVVTVYPTTQQWDFITAIANTSTIRVRKELFGYTVYERLEEFEFLYVRYNRGYKSCKKDRLGLVGFSRIDLQDPTVIITEGVSDYLTVKACNPHLNVLGLLNLTGNSLAKTFLISCFKNFVYIADNDNPGMSAAKTLKDFLLANVLNSRFILIQPESGYKDIAQQVFFKYKRDKLPLNEF